jgi:4-amino-4-deoxy-L-arabinose transferase-like glycosyltransferase
MGGAGGRWIAGGALAAAAVAGLMLGTEPGLAIAWDEGYTLGREARVRDWLARMIDPTRAPVEEPELALVPPEPEGSGVRRPGSGEVRSRRDLLRPEVIAWSWPFAREEPHGHPPFYAIVGLAGDVLAPGWAPLPRARLGPILAFSLAGGAAFAAVGRRRGGWAASATLGAWALHPHLFALGHYAHYDGLLASLWLGAILAFGRAVEGEGADRGWRPRWGAAVAFGMLAGLAAATKLTGWLLPLPFAAWAALARDRRAFSTLAVGGLVAALVLYAVTPPFWADPVRGVGRFLESNLSRAKTISLPVMFLGRVVRTPAQSLPWYNTLLWTAAATPLGLLALALPGLRLARRADPLAGLAAVNWIFLLALRAMPHTPGHDGVRQFLPAFGCLALLAGLGAGAAVERLGRRGKLLVAAALAEAAASVALMMPVPLSYFGPAVGGLPGAARLGLEPTYYWDALGAETRAWLDAHTPRGAAVRFARFTRSFDYLYAQGLLHARPIGHDSRAPATWYVVQNRPGMLRPTDRALIASARPRWVVRKLGVPLLWVFDDADRAAVEGRAPGAPG